MVKRISLPQSEMNELNMWIELTDLTFGAEWASSLLNITLEVWKVDEWAIHTSAPTIYPTVYQHIIKETTLLTRCGPSNP